MNYPHIDLVKQSRIDQERKRESVEAQIDRLAREVTGDVSGYLLGLATARMGVSNLRDFLEAYEELSVWHVGLDPNEVTTDRLEAAYVDIREEFEQ